MTIAKCKKCRKAFATPKHIEDKENAICEECHKAGCGKWFKSVNKNGVGIDTQCGYQYRRNTRRHLCNECRKAGDEK